MENIEAREDSGPSPRAAGNTHVVILGAGPAGTGAAYQLTRKGFAQITVLEQRDTVGGNAGSFDLGGLRVDYGSHRLHPACDPGILRDLSKLLDGDLLLRPRHGRIRLRGRWIHFPLKPIDLVTHLPISFTLGVASDVAGKLITPAGGATETFATVLERSLGRTICRDFYFPYARKLWGLPPDQLSVTQAKRRVSANSLPKMMRKIASSVPGLKPPSAGKFYYPRHGYGQISERLFEEARNGGAKFRFGAKVTAIERQGNYVKTVRFEQDGRECKLDTSLVWSTLPLTVLANSIQPSAPAEVLAAASKISFRGMILIYLLLDQEQFTEYDAHYFPEESIPISRLSEPKNYAGTFEPSDRTVLCAELPSDPSTLEWSMQDEEIGLALCRWLDDAGIAVKAKVLEVKTRRLRQAYPIYQAGYEEFFETLDRWVEGVEGLLTFGRQGLFAHDNTHHALYMAYSAVECLRGDGSFDRDKWRRFRSIFETHVVED